MNILFYPHSEQEVAEKQKDNGYKGIKTQPNTLEICHPADDM